MGIVKKLAELKVCLIVSSGNRWKTFFARKSTLGINLNSSELSEFVYLCSSKIDRTVCADIQQLIEDLTHGTIQFFMFKLHLKLF